MMIFFWALLALLIITAIKALTEPAARKYSPKSNFPQYEILYPPQPCSGCKHVFVQVAMKEVRCIHPESMKYNNMLDNLVRQEGYYRMGGVYPISSAILEQAPCGPKRKLFERGKMAYDSGHLLQEKPPEWLWREYKKDV